jgi:uncharacterized protein DUF488
MIARYRIVRGARPTGEPLPAGVRQDTRKHTRHVLRPEAAMVQAFLAAPGDAAFRTFRAAYLELLERRFAEDRRPFDELAELARGTDVYLGCNCPTTKQPDVRHCHTWLALGFMKRCYRELEVRRA